MYRCNNRYLIKLYGGDHGVGVPSDNIGFLSCIRIHTTRACTNKQCLKLIDIERKTGINCVWVINRNLKFYLKCAEHQL